MRGIRPRIFIIPDATALFRADVLDQDSPAEQMQIYKLLKAAKKIIIFPDKP